MIAALMIWNACSKCETSSFMSGDLMKCTCVSLVPIYDTQCILLKALFSSIGDNICDNIITYESPLSIEPLMPKDYGRIST